MSYITNGFQERQTSLSKPGPHPGWPKGLLVDWLFMNASLELKLVLALKFSACWGKLKGV